MHVFEDFTQSLNLIEWLTVCVHVCSKWCVVVPGEGHVWGTTQCLATLDSSPLYAIWSLPPSPHLVVVYISVSLFVPLGPCGFPLSPSSQLAAGILSVYRCCLSTSPRLPYHTVFEFSFTYQKPCCLITLVSIPLRMLSGAIQYDQFSPWQLLKAVFTCQRIKQIMTAVLVAFKKVFSETTLQLSEWLLHTSLWLYLVWASHSCKFGIPFWRQPSRCKYLTT